MTKGRAVAPLALDRAADPCQHSTRESIMNADERPLASVLVARRREPGRPGRPAGRPARSREEILAAAAEVFRRDGYHAARMDDIAEVLGMAKASLYHYVRTKHELLFEIILPPYRDFVDHLDAVLASSAPVPERIAEVVGRHLDNVVRYSPAISIYVENLRSLPLPAELSELDARYLRGLRGLLAAGMADGSLRESDPAIAADALLGMCNWFAVRHSAQSPFDPAALASIVSSIFLDGMAAAPSRHRAPARRRHDG